MRLIEDEIPPMTVESCRAEAMMEKCIIRVNMLSVSKRRKKKKKKIKIPELKFPVLTVQEQLQHLQFHFGRFSCRLEDAVTVNQHFPFAYDHS